MRRLRTWLLSCIAIGSVVSAVMAPQAFADRSDCPGQYVCLWDGETYGGERRQFHDNGWQNLTDFGFNDVASSVYNNTNRYARFAEHINGGGAAFCLLPGGYSSIAGWYLNNKISSVWLGPSPAC